jgi:hypothetical protein
MTGPETELETTRNQWHALAALPAAGGASRRHAFFVRPKGACKALFSDLVTRKAVWFGQIPFGFSKSWIPCREFQSIVQPIAQGRHAFAWEKHAFCIGKDALAQENTIQHRNHASFCESHCPAPH